MDLVTSEIIQCKELLVNWFSVNCLSAPEKLLNRYEKRFEKREKKIRKNDPKRDRKSFSPSQAA